MGRNVVAGTTEAQEGPRSNSRGHRDAVKVYVLVAV